MQVTKGLRAILSNPNIYDFFQNLMGADAIRRELVSQSIKPFKGMRILDIGCGTGRILDYLPEVSYCGFDLSMEYIENAQLRYGARGEFNCALLEEISLNDRDTFDIVISVGVIHHLDDFSALKLFEVANSALKKGGRFVTLDPCFDDQQNFLAKFLVSRDRGQNVRNADQYRALADKFFNCVVGGVKHRTWIPYTHWAMGCTK